MLNPVVFIRWHESVAQSLIQIRNRHGEKLLQVPYSSDIRLQEVDSFGIYGIYDGQFFGIFRTFKDEYKTLDLCMGESLYKISPNTEISQDINTFNRIFRINLTNGRIDSFKYRKILWNLFHNAMGSKIEYFFDDWWGLQCDLPSWVYSTFHAEGIDGVSVKIEQYVSKALGDDFKNLSNYQTKFK